MSGRGPYPGRATVTNLCPDCGGEAALTETDVRVLRGACSACGHAFTVLRELEPTDRSAPAGPSPTPAGRTPEGAPSAVATGGPSCGVCSAAMTVRTVSETSLEAHCASCGTSFTYVLTTVPLGAPREEGRLGPRGPRRGPSAVPGGRPCRECGGPIRFSTDEQGNTSGECTSCGNRFTLPPRREFGGGGRGGRPDARGPRRSFSPGFRPPGRWPRQADGDRPRRFPSARPPFRRERRPREAEDDDESFDRRRRRRQER